MNKVLLALSILVLSGTVLAQESPTTARAEHVQIIQGPEIPLVGGYLTVIRWTVNNPGGVPVHYGVVHYGTDPKVQKSNPIEPYPFGDGVPREPVQPAAEDDLLLHRGVDGF